MVYNGSLSLVRLSQIIPNSDGQRCASGLLTQSWCSQDKDFYLNWEKSKQLQLTSDSRSQRKTNTSILWVRHGLT